MTPSVQPGPRSARAGLTLLEIVLATGVLSVVLLGMFSAMAHGSRMNGLRREREAATRRALEYIELRVMSANTDTAFDALTTLTESFDVQLTTGDGNTFSLPPAQLDALPNNLAGQLVVTGDLNGNGSDTDDEGYYDGKPNMLLATATVRWRSAYGGPGTTAGDQDQEVVVSAMKVRYVP